MKTKKVTMYFVITFVWAWIIWVPFVLPSFGLYPMTELLDALIMPSLTLAAFGPLVAAVILTYRNGGGASVKEYFKKCLDFKISFRYYVLAVVFAMGTVMLSHYATNLLKIDVLPKTLLPSDITIPIYVLVIPYLLMMFLIGGGQEEFGWRGYAQDPLQDRFGIIKGSLFLGFMWGLWHAPLWLIQGEGHAYYSLLAFIVFTTSWSLVIGIVYNLSGKKMVIAWVMHSVNNVAVPLFPVLFMEDVPQPGYWVFAFVNVLTAIGIGLWYTRKNKTRDETYVRQE